MSFKLISALFMLMVMVTGLACNASPFYFETEEFSESSEEAEEAIIIIEDEEEPLISESSSEMEVGSQMTGSGLVIDTIDDCAFDGICAYVVDNLGTEIAVIYAPGMLRCEGQIDSGVLLGDTISFYGEVVSPTQVNVCSSSDYYLIRETE